MPEGRNLGSTGIGECNDLDIHSSQTSLRKARHLIARPTRSKHSQMGRLLLCQRKRTNEHLGLWPIRLVRSCYNIDGAH